ncbi:MAG: TonB-dependent receptor plug domain-containing protein [Tannerella sp.]|jgi:hypothetical protein|nr:TonB-dependent receptor plug domain-containing protein [Tannerella sp.]
MKKILFTAVFFLLIIKVSGQVSIENIQDSINNQLLVYPQEKLHLHTDRNYYVPGEKIWFKAYLVDAVTHQALSKSRYVYVELINASDSLVDRVMILQSTDNMFYGHIFLSEIVPEGYYTLRAYTRYMDNMGEDYFFKKTIRIGNLKAGSENDKKKKKKPSEDYEVSFYPEGGSLQEGTLCVVAFKALNKNGYAVDVTGTVVDAAGTVICDVSTYYSGMGNFTILSESNKEYFLKCKNEKGREKQFKLPKARKDCSIKTLSRGNNWYVSVNKSPAFSESEQQLYLLIHCRGSVIYFASWNPQKEYLSFSKKQFPSGVIQILLLDSNMNPLSERLIFNKNEDDVKLAFSTGKPFYEKREKVNVDISITDNEGAALPGNLSVAITDNNDIQPDTACTILSSLLLSSELRGHIENPAFYLQNTPNAAFSLDLLMQTHGWRRYNVPEVIKGKVEYPEYAFEETKYITGQVKSFLLEKPLANGDVSMLSSSGGFGIVTTNSMGYFSFFGFEYPDSTNFFIKANNQKGSEKVILSVNLETFPKLQHISGIHDYEEETVDSAFIQKAEQRALYDDDMRVIYLEEVVITGKRKIAKKDEIRLQNWVNASSDNTIYREDIEKRHAHRITDMLYSVAGVSVGSDGSVRIRGASGPPLVLVDGFEMEWMPGSDSPLEQIMIDDVESIDVFKSGGAAIFGTRGGNGAISITTRQGSSDIKAKRSFNFTSISPLGFQNPVEFYSPKYETSQEKQSINPDYRTTIFWKPDILISKEGKASFEFYSADFPTTYSVVIEGLSSDGQIIRQIEKIEVK